MSKTLFKIENGKFGLALVGAGDDPTWQTPGGADPAEVTMADYDTEASGFACQVVTGVLSATANTTTENIDGTWCDLPEVKTVTGEDSFSVAWDAYQDPNAIGLAAYLYQHRGAKAYLYFGAGGDGVPPTAFGVVTLTSMGIGGGRSAARSQFTMAFDRAPDIMFGTAAAWLLVYGDKSKPPVEGPPPAPGALADTDIETETVDDGEAVPA